MESDASVSPVYEYRSYTLNPKDYGTAVDLVTEHYALRTKHSKLFGFWTTDIGSEVAQFVHIWEYESMSERRRVKALKADDQERTEKLIDPLLPCIQKWNQALLTQSPGFELNVDFEEDETAVYLMDEAEINSFKDLPDLKATDDDGTEILVGRFCALFGQSKTEYRLWRYTDVDEAAACAKKRAFDSPFDGNSTLLVPTDFSPLK